MFYYGFGTMSWPTGAGLMSAQELPQDLSPLATTAEVCGLEAFRALKIWVT